MARPHRSTARLHGDSRPVRRRNFGAALAVAAALATTANFAQGPGDAKSQPSAAFDTGPNRNLDARIGLRSFALSAPLNGQQDELNDLRAVMPDLRVEYEQSTGATFTLWNMGGFLTPADARDPQAIAEDFMTARATLLGLTEADVADSELTDSVYSDITGVTHLYYRQRLNGVPVYNAQLQVNIAKDGRIVSVNNAYLPNLIASVASLAPATDAVAAVARAGEHLGIDALAARVVASPLGLGRTTELDAPELSTEPIKAELMLLPIQRGQARLVWNFQTWTPDGQHAFDFNVDAESGQIWTRFDWVAGDQYRVYAQPTESPSHGGQTVVVDPRDAIASLFGWHDTNGAAGAEFTTTQGNNVHAYTDTDDNDVPDPGSSPNCGASLNCDFAINLAQSPSTYRPAAVTNLFYWNNVIHDIQYRYGFNEAAGSFQENNYGRGGLGGDGVNAEAQDGSGINNANFGTPPDGSRPRMQMFLWDHSTPNRDGDLDAGIIVHEYGHGISSRQVGGPSNVSCLGNDQQPGEGISDFLSMAYTARIGQTGALARGMATYALNQPTTGTGLRDQPYSTNNAVNNWTYQTISGMDIPHGVGSVWAQGMWEVYWALVDHYGFDPNLYDAAGGAGNQRAMLYNNEGMKFSACSPGFTQLRDGILQAVQTIDDGADYCRVWSAFAAFGLGANAVNPSPNSIAGIVNGFDVPIACGGTSSPDMSITDVTVTEGNAGTKQFGFTVSLAASTATQTRVSYAAADGTAVAEARFTSGGPITVNDNAAAAPYPATVSVSGLTGTVQNLAVRLNGVSHAFASDLEVVLVGPAGQRVRLWSDTGGGTVLANAVITFRDGAPAMTTGVIASGTYSPTDLSPIGEGMPAPAPAPPYASALSVFNGTDPSGTWSLYVADDEAPDSGSITSFTLLFRTTGNRGDYVPVSGQLIFPPGTTTQTINVTVNGDNENEPDETFFVNLSSPINATLVDGQGVGTIVNDDVPPTAAPDTYETPYLTTLNLAAPGVLANDSANGAPAMTALLVTSPTRGTLTLNANGSFSYTPQVDFVGADSFTYSAVTSAGTSVPAIVSLTVVGVPPTAAPDTYETPYLTTLNLAAPGVLANDSANGALTMTASLVTGATHGTLTLNANGSFSYTPQTDFVGADSFTYSAVTSAGTSAPAIVSLTVVGVPPTTVSDTYETPYLTTLNLAAPGVLANDSSNGGGAMTAELLSSTSNGLLSLSADGTVSYTPDVGFAGIDSFTYRAVNGGGTGGVSTVSIAVLAPTTVQAPYNLRVDLVRGNTVTLRWDVLPIGPQASTFVLEGGLHPGEVLASIPTSDAAPIFTFEAPTGSFRIRIHGQLGADKSPASNEIPLHVNVPVTPSAPANLLGLVNGSTLGLAWKNTFMGGAPGGFFLDVTGSLAASIPIGASESFGFTGVPGGSYTLSLRAANGGGVSGSSNPVTVSFPGACSGAPAPPERLLTYRLGNTAHVVWEPATNGAAPASYVLHVSGSFVGTFPSASRQLSSPVGPGSYTVSVSAVNACGTSAPTAPQVVVVP
jgi:extracellular elastinolytic metalloproteinase